MLNQVVLVGRLTSDIVLEKVNDKDICYINLAVARQFKNEDGVYDNDLIKCKLWNGIAVNTCEYGKKGDTIGIKGRLQSYTTEDGTIMEVVAEKVTFLSSKKEEEE